jgi:hypothetical protein
MGGLRKWSPPKDVSMDGGLEWNCSRLHFQLEITQEDSGDPQKRGGSFQQTQREDGFLLHGQRSTYHFFNKGSSKTLYLHMLAQQLKALEVTLGCRLEVIHVPGTTMITKGIYGLIRGYGKMV